MFCIKPLNKKRDKNSLVPNVRGIFIIDKDTQTKGYGEEIKK